MKKYTVCCNKRVYGQNTGQLCSMCRKTWQGTKNKIGKGGGGFGKKGRFNAFPEEAGPFPIAINHDNNTVSFQIQNGPVKENGVNGCQVLTMIQTSLIIIKNLNKRFPCMENDITIENLESAIAWQENRTLNREKRNVEGTSET